MKNIKISLIILVLGIIAILVLPSKNDNSKTVSVSTESTSTKSKKSQDIKSLKNQFVSTSQDTNIYNKDLKIVGKVSNHFTVMLSSEIKDNYVRIDQSSWYINANDVTLQKNTSLNRNNLEVLQDIKLKKGTNIYNKDNDILVTLTKSQTLPCVTVDNKKVGVLFQDNIYFVDSADVETKLVTVDNSAQSVPVMMYHFFYSEANGESRTDVNYVEVNEFREQLQYLKDNEYATLTMEELYYFLNNQAKVPENSVVISIDDGAPSVYKYAYPLLKEYEMNTTLFLITGWIEENTMTNEFRAMEADGLELQSHTNLMHEGGCSEQRGGKMLCVGVDDGVADINQSIAYIDNDVFVFCYPFGDVNKNAINILQQTDIKMAFTTKHGKVSPGMDLLQLPRIRVTGGAGIDSFIWSLQ